MKNKITAFLNKFFGKLISFFPSSIPTGLPGAPTYESWASSIIRTYDLPDNASIRFALAVCILHSDNEVKTASQFLLGYPAKRSKRYFALKLMKGAANQIAGGVMEELKNKQQELARKEQEAAKAAPPAMSIVPNNESGAV